MPLAKVDSDTVEEWQMAFSRSGGAGARELRFKVAELLFMTAWDEGPQPISAEHIDDFYAIIVEDVAAKDLPLLDAHLPALLEFLAKKQLIGPLRLERLSAVHRTVLADVLRHNEGDDEGDESDDDAGDDEDE